jgi:hypothetical protein
MGSYRYKQNIPYACFREVNEIIDKIAHNYGGAEASYYYFFFEKLLLVQCIELYKRESAQCV